MNTSKQVNVMVGLLFVFLVSLLLYFLWDSVRADEAKDEQLEANAERGAKLFSLNCRACHGITGRGPVENPNLPGAPLNLEDNRPTDPGKLQERQARLRDTIRCGRIGTLMPPWADDQGGSLNAFQVEQLVALITGAMPGLDPPADPNAVSEAGWEAAVEEANHTDLLDKQLAKEVDAEVTTLTLTDARGLSIDGLLRIDEEVVKIADAPAETKLSRDVAAEAEEVPVVDSSRFQAGDIVQVDDEKMRVTAASKELLDVARGVDGTGAEKHSIGDDLFEPGNEIEVGRGAFGTTAAAHSAGAEVYNGPLEPQTGPLTGEGAIVPCGQLGIAAAASPTPTAAVPVSGSVVLNMGDNFFDLNGQRNPSLEVKMGQTVTFSLSNQGAAVHNLRIAGPDGKYQTEDDAVSNPPAIPGGGSGVLEYAPSQAGTFNYQCDFHPAQMKGTITSTQ